MGSFIINLSNPNLVRSIVWYAPRIINSAIARPTAGACWIPENNYISCIFAT